MLLLALPPFPLVVAGAVVIGALQDRVVGATSWRPALVRRIGAIAVGAAVVAGNVWLGFGIADILA